MIYLQTDRLILRDYSADDIDAYYRLKTDEQTMYYMQDIKLDSFDAAKEELADVLNYCLQMCIALNLDPIEIVNSKMDITEKKYPIDKAKSVATKYNKL